MSDGNRKRKLPDSDESRRVRRAKLRKTRKEIRVEAEYLVRRRHVSDASDEEDGGERGNVGQLLVDEDEGGDVGQLLVDEDEGGDVGQLLADNGGDIADNDDITDDEVVGSEAESDPGESSAQEDEHPDGDDPFAQLDQQYEEEVDLAPAEAGDGGEDEEFQPVQRTVFGDLANWYMSGSRNVKPVQFSALVEIINFHWIGGGRLPIDARTYEPKLKSSGAIWRKMVDAKTHQCEQYAHLGLKYVLEHLLRGSGRRHIIGGGKTIYFDLYVDGVTKYKSPGGLQKQHEFWPLLVRVENVRGLEREMALVGVQYGKKPEPFLYFRDFIDDFITLGDEDEQIVLEDGCRVDVQIFNICADMPARSMITGTVAHTAYAACTRCACSGTYLSRSRQMQYPSTRRGGRDNELYPIRTDESFRARSQATHHRQPSVFEFRLPALDMIRTFGIDGMHLNHLGVEKRWLYYSHTKTFSAHPEKSKQPPPRVPPTEKTAPVLSETLGFPPLCLQSEKNKYLIPLINERMVSFIPHCPSEFQRLPREYTDSEKYHATEFRRLFLYDGAAALVGKVDSRMSDNFLLYHYALRILSDPVLCVDEDKLQDADDCLRRFVRHSSEIYGKEFITVSVHMLLHLVAEVRMKRKPLQDFSAFIAENEYRKLLKYVSAPYKPLEQLVNKVRKKMIHAAKQWPGGARQEEAARRALPSYRSPRPRRQNATKTLWCVYRTDHFCFRSHFVRDCFAELEEDGQIKMIKCSAFDSRGFVLGRYLLLSSVEFYEYPYRASSIGIRLDTGVGGGQKHTWPIEQLRRKVYRLPTWKLDKKGVEFHVLIPLIHSRKDQMVGEGVNGD